MVIVRPLLIALGGALIASASAAWAAPTADAARGKALFSRCAGCHASAAGKRSIGPHLSKIVGRKAASVTPFAYSPAFTRLKIVWDRGTLDKFLASPQKMGPGSNMAFAGMTDAAQRADLIAYLATLQD